MRAVSQYIDQHLLKPMMDYMIEQQAFQRTPLSRSEQLWFGLVVVLVLLTAVWPGPIAEIFSTQIGPVWMSIIWRSLNVMLAIYIIFYVQKVPTSQKWILGCYIVGLEGDIARNVFDLQPLTLSFALVLLGISLSSFRILSRPTIYEIFEAKDKEVISLREEIARLEVDLSREKAKVNAGRAGGFGRRSTDRSFR